MLRLALERLWRLLLCCQQVLRWIRLRSSCAALCSSSRSCAGRTGRKMCDTSHSTDFCSKLQTMVRVYYTRLVQTKAALCKVAKLGKLRVHSRAKANVARIVVKGKHTLCFA